MFPSTGVVKDTNFGQGFNGTLIQWRKGRGLLPTFCKCPDDLADPLPILGSDSCSDKYSSMDNVLGDGDDYKSSDPGTDHYTGGSRSIRKLRTIASLS